MKTVEILKAAKAKIATPERWIKHSLSSTVDIDGQPTQCYCAVGAINAAYSDAYKDPNWEFPWPPDDPFLVIESSLPFGVRISSFNDDPNTTHQDVMGLFDRAIEKASA
jgi:hypothetical protein